MITMSNTSESKLPWLRLYWETRTDAKIARVCLKTQQPKVVVLGLWTILMCYAGESPDRGKLLISDDLPLTAEDIAFEAGTGS